MSESRRQFLKYAGVSLAGAGCVLPVARALALSEGKSVDGKQWAMVVDVGKCLEQGDCTACFDTCHAVHNVPRIDDIRHEVKWIWKEQYEHAFPEQAHAYTNADLKGKPVTVLCNHCERPPCTRVCPTQATWKRESDGIVMMDMHRCIGCRYCMAACPYGARSFNFTDPRPFIAGIHDGFPTRTRGVVEKCNFCSERLAQGLRPACVEVCQKQGANALAFGDLADPSSEVRRILETVHTVRRKPGLGTNPNVFYVV